MTVRTRSLLAAAAVAVVLFWGLSSHGLSHASHVGIAAAASGLCLLLVGVLRHPGLPQPEAHSPIVVTAVPEIAPAIPLWAPPDIRARASPSALQRFRN